MAPESAFGEIVRLLASNQATASPVLRVGDHQWLVPSSTQAMWRLVTRHELSPAAPKLPPAVWSCSCPAWTEAPERRSASFSCRHVERVQCTLGRQRA